MLPSSTSAASLTPTDRAASAAESSFPRRSSAALSNSGAAGPAAASYSPFNAGGAGGGPGVKSSSHHGGGPAQPQSSTGSGSPYKRHPSSSLSGQSPPEQFGHAGSASAVVPEDQSAKKRRTGPGSRGVANLTPEQLAKKRANDREAQRAIRERTKNQIEALEKKISELTSQQPYQELQKIIREKEAVEAENEEIKARLASILSLINPYLSTQQAGGGHNSPAGSSYNVLRPPPPRPNPAPSNYSAQNASTPGSAASPAASGGGEITWNGRPIPQLMSQASPVSDCEQPQPPGFGRSLEMGRGDHLELGFLLDPSQQVQRVQEGPNGAQDSGAYSHLPIKHDWKGSQSFASSHQGDMEQWALNGPFMHCEPTCPLDDLLLDFLRERRQREMEGASAQELVGPRYPSVSSLLNPQVKVHSHPVSRVFTDILGTFPDIYRLPEKVAVLYIMFLITRWMISPTQENLDLLPELAKPVPCQYNTPHPAWLDHLPFPAMRDFVIRNWARDKIMFEDFFVPYTGTVSLNWPYEETDVLLKSADGIEVLINPVFERHMFRQENWTLGDKFDRAYPQLRGTYRLKSDGSGHTPTSSSHAGSV